MTCSKTKKAIDAWKQQSIGELPQILLLHLKWFDYKMNGCSKIVKKVKFPINLQFDPSKLNTFSYYLIYYYRVYNNRKYFNLLNDTIVIIIFPFFFLELLTNKKGPNSKERQYRLFAGK